MGITIYIYILILKQRKILTKEDLTDTQLLLYSCTTFDNRSQPSLRTTWDVSLKDFKIFVPDCQAVNSVVYSTARGALCTFITPPADSEWQKQKKKGDVVRRVTSGVSVGLTFITQTEEKLVGSWNRIWAVLLWMDEIYSNRKKTPTPTSPKSARLSDVCYTFHECRDKKRWFTFFAVMKC